MRTISEAEVIAIKGATEASFVQGGGVTSFALFTGVGVSTLSKYANTNMVSDENGVWKMEYPDNVIRVDVAVEADRRAGHPWIVGEAARQLGFRLEPLAERIRNAGEVTERDAHVVLSEAMDVSRALIDAFNDGKIDALDRKILRRELRELIEAAQRILEKLGED